MSAHRVKVIRLDLPLDGASFDAIINAEPTLELQIGPAFGDDAAAWQALWPAATPVPWPNTHWA